MSEPDVKDPRAKQLGEWLFAWRQKRGLSRPEAVAEALKHDPRASLSSDYLSKLEYGIRNLASASLDTREALRLALDIKREVWEEETGLLVPAPTSRANAFSAGARGWRAPEPEPTPIPDALVEAADLYGGMPGVGGLREYRWQRWMTDSPHLQRPQTPDEWLTFFLSVKDRFNPKEPSE